LGLVATGGLWTQSVSGPVLSYVVDEAARMRPVYGLPGSAHVGSAMREGVRETWGGLALLTDGTAMRGAEVLEGRWAQLQAGAFLDSSGRTVLIAGDRGPAWRLSLPERALAVRVSASGGRVLTLLADESLAAWSAGGKAEWRIGAGAWWSIAFAGERALVYDPAAHTLLWLDEQGGMRVARGLEGEGGRYQLAVDADGRRAVLLGERTLLVGLDGGAVRAVETPEGAERLEALPGTGAYLLTRDPARPMWVLDPAREEALLVIPALGVATGGQQ
jgi:hypothetical protein